jgi:hypothetical protein
VVKDLGDAGLPPEMTGGAEPRLRTPLGLVATVTVVEASTAQRPVLDRLLQLYLHDFSEFAPIGGPHGEVDEEGRFIYPGLDSYWQRDGHIPLLIRADRHLAGFVLVSEWSALGLPLDHVVAEFFVLRKYWRTRVGTRRIACLSPISGLMGGAGGLVQRACPGVLAGSHRGGGPGRSGGDRRKWKNGGLDRSCAPRQSRLE